MLTLEERRGSRWVALSTRNDEVADVVKDALGMGVAQFAKVVLLPQGDFAAFPGTNCRRAERPPFSIEVATRNRNAPGVLIFSVCCLCSP